MKIALVSVPVKNPVDAYKFYTDVLGFTAKIYMPEANLAIVVSPDDVNGTSLLLEPTDKAFYRKFQEEVYNAGLPVIVLYADDVQKEYERLKDLGVVFKKEPTKSDWGTEAIFDDTCGNYIQIHHP